MRLFQQAKSFVGSKVREIAWHAAFPRSAGLPKVLFFPSSGREGASLLRAYLIAESLRRRGWAALAVDPRFSLAQRRRAIRRFQPDLIVFQQCRHTLNSPEHAMGIPFFLDIDDADFFDPKLTERLERTASGAVGVIAGSRFIRDWALPLNPNSRVIWTGTPAGGATTLDHSLRPPVVAWAQSEPLHYPEELRFVTALCRRIAGEGAQFRLRLYGVADAGDRDSLRRELGEGVEVEFLPHMPYADFLQSLRQVSVGLSPIIPQSPFSRGKSFGKVLGYLDAGVPVVASDEADHSLFFTAETGVISNDPDRWAEAVKRLLADPAARNAMAAAASKDFLARLSTETAARLTDQFLRRALTR